MIDLLVIPSAYSETQLESEPLPDGNKSDKNGWFAILRENMIYTFLIGTVIVSVFVGFAVFWWKKITCPLHSQCHSAELLAANEALNNEVNERKQAEEKLRQYQEQLRALASELSMAEEQERRHIATELHDNIVQNLAFSKIKLGYLKKKSVSQKLDGAFQEIIELIDQTIQSSRSLTFELSPPMLYELGFEPAVEWLTEQFSDQHNIFIDFKDDGQPKPLDNETRILLFRSVRELLVNTIKHAQARKVGVSLKRKGQTLMVKVEDDGIGFEPVAILSHTDRTRGFGLFSIRDRLDYRGGRLELESSPGKGTRATMTAPLANADVIIKDNII